MPLPQKIGSKELQQLLKPILEAVLRDTGWTVTRLERRYELDQGVAADCVARFASGSSKAALVVEVQAHPRPKSVREKAVLLQHLVSESPFDEPTAVAFFVPRVTGSLAELLRELEVGYFDLQGACCLRWPGLYVDRPLGLATPPGGARASRSSSPDSAIVPTPTPGEGRVDCVVRVPTLQLSATVLQPTVSVGESSAIASRAVKKHNVLRVMLSYPQRRWHQVELAAEAAVSVYTAHSVVRWVLQEHHGDYEGRGPRKVVFLERPGVLLDAWSNSWGHTWRQSQRTASGYYCLARNVDDVRERMAQAAGEVGARLGFTLSAGANRYGAYLRDELVHAYFTGPEEEFARAADLDPVARGANVYLYAARDDGLFYLPEDARRRLRPDAGASVTPVCPVQAYLDMKAAGGRYAEQAEVLRQEVLGY